MAIYSRNKLGQKSITMFYCFWLVTIGVITAFSQNNRLVVITVLLMLFALFFVIRHRIKESTALKEICSFYVQAHQLYELEIDDIGPRYNKMLQTVTDLGEFDWTVLFLFDREKKSFEAVDSYGISLSSFGTIKLEDIVSEEQQKMEPAKLSYALLHRVFKIYDFKGALAGATLLHDKTYFGCLLVGRYDDENVLTVKDNFKLDLLSDQVSVCLNNYQTRKELEYRAEKLAERQASIQRELDMARIVQEGALPRSIPNVKGLDIASFIKPARCVGGDFIRYVYNENDTKLGFLIGDVCGKGVPASLVMSVVYCLFKEKGNIDKNPSELMKDINVSLKEFLGAGSHFNSTALWGVFDMEKMTFTYANAGHDFPLQYCAESRSLAELPSTGTLLGIFIESEYETRTYKINHGDKMIFYSDGLIDFFEDKEKCDDGYKYLIDFFKNRQNKSSTEIIDEIKNMVENNPEAAKDDITASVITIQ